MKHHFANTADLYIEKRKRDGLYRSLENKSYPLDFGSNDYLGLSEDSTLQGELKKIDAPLGSTSSRLISGNHSSIQKAEACVAEFKQSETATLFSSGYAANIGLMQALALENTQIFSDEKNHASIIDGIKLAKFDRKSIYPHLDYEALDSLLKESTFSQKVVVSETIFSMDGDRVDAKKLKEICDKHQALLVVDEAHSIGIDGENGRGVMGDDIVTVIPCGKAVNLMGGFVCGPAWLKELLVNRARSFIYTTGFSPYLSEALVMTFAYLKEIDHKRNTLKEVKVNFFDQAKRFGVNLVDNGSHIIPHKVSFTLEAKDFESCLQNEGVYLKVMRPPTVINPQLRFSLRANLNKEHMSSLFSHISSML